MASQEEDLVMMPVPRSRVPEVYRLLAGSSANGAVKTEDAATPVRGHSRPSASGGSATDNGWPPELIERDYHESPDSMKAILEEMAANPEQELTTDDFARVLGSSTSKVAGALGAYGRRTRNRYGRSNWSFEAAWDDARRQVIYKMPQRVADIISAL
jgi:hypothetical protein